MADLPPELIALIIDTLCHAQSTLRQCALVCRAWLPPSQRQLFHTYDTIELHNVVPFRDFLLGAPHLAAYIREVSLYYLRPFNKRAPELSLMTATDQEDVQSLFTLFPNITKISVHFVTPPQPFLFPNALLRQCTELQKLKVFSFSDAVSPAVVLSSVKGTTVKSLDLRTDGSAASIDPQRDGVVCESIECITLDSPHNLPVWFPYLRLTLPHWTELKIFCPVHVKLPPWSHALRTCDLSHLRQLHIRVIVVFGPIGVRSFFPDDGASPLFPTSAPEVDHLLLTIKVLYTALGSYRRIDIKVVISSVEWYRRTFTAIKESTVKELTLTAIALDDPAIAAAWEKVDDVLSMDVFRTLEHVHFFDETKTRIETWSCPSTARILQQALPKLLRGGKLAV